MSAKVQKKKVQIEWQITTSRDDVINGAPTGTWNVYGTDSAKITQESGFETKDATVRTTLTKISPHFLFPRADRTLYKFGLKASVNAGSNPFTVTPRSFRFRFQDASGVDQLVYWHANISGRYLPGDPVVILAAPYQCLPENVTSVHEPQMGTL